MSIRSLWTPSRVVGVIAYAVVGISLVVLFISDARQDEFDARRDADIAAANAATVKCVVKAIRADAGQTKELRDATQLKDDELTLAMQALIPIVQFRVIEGGNTSEQVVEAANQFITQAGHFIEENARLKEARRQNKVPKTICGVNVE